MQSPPAPRDPLAAALTLAWEMSARPLPGALADDALRAMDRTIESMPVGSPARAACTQYALAARAQRSPDARRCLAQGLREALIGEMRRAATARWAGRADING